MLAMSKTSIRMIVATALAVYAVPAFSEDPKPRSIQSSPAQTVERPFGGPPNRAPRRPGKRCETSSITCALDEVRSIGSDCVCVEADNTSVGGRVVP